MGRINMLGNSRNRHLVDRAVQEDNSRHGK
jgi:hypothetical protein